MIENGVSAASGRCNAIDSLLYIDKTPKTLYSERNGDGYCKYARFANIVVLNADWLSIDKMTPKRIGTLPAGYRPSYSVIGMGYSRGSDGVGQITVNVNGDVICYSTVYSECYFGGSVVFPINVS